MYLLIVAGQSILFGGLSAILANDKNRSVPAWMLIGAVASVFGFIAAIAVSEKEEVETEHHNLENPEQARSEPEVEGVGTVGGIVVGVVVLAILLIVALGV